MPELFKSDREVGNLFALVARRRLFLMYVLNIFVDLVIQVSNGVVLALILEVKGMNFIGEILDGLVALSQLFRQIIGFSLHGIVILAVLVVQCHVFII